MHKVPDMEEQDNIQQIGIKNSKKNSPPTKLEHGSEMTIWTGMFVMLVERGDIFLQLALYDHFYANDPNRVCIYLHNSMCWSGQYREFQQESDLLLSNMIECSTPNNFNNNMSLDIMLNYEESPASSEQDYYDPQHDPQSEWRGPPVRPKPRRLGRCQWSEHEEICFFNFSAQWMMENPGQLLDWKKCNKKGIFQKMTDAIGTKDAKQCRLKFSSYKRRHSHKKDKINYKPCMRVLVMEKLEEMASTHQKSAELLGKLKMQDQKLREVATKMKKDAKQATRDMKQTKEIYNMLMAIDKVKTSNLKNETRGRPKVSKNEEEKQNQKKMKPDLHETRSRMADQEGIEQFSVASSTIHGKN